MKTTTIKAITHAGATAAMLPMGALAQSSVTMYGLLDHALVVVSKAPNASQRYINANGINGNRLGFTGRENLGDGVSAVFTLENGFDGSTGAMGMGNRAFGSQALVGLETPFGAALAGRQVNVDIWTVGLLSAANQWAGLAGTHPGDNDNYYNTFRVPNALKYLSTSYAGFQFQGLYGLGELQGDKGRVAALAVKYESGPLKAALSVSDAKNPNIGLAAGTGPADAPVVATTNYYSQVIVSGYASAKGYRVTGAGVNYEAGPVTLGLVHSISEFRELGDLASGPNPGNFRGNAKFRNIELSARYAVSSAWQLGVEYVDTRRNSVATIAAPAGSGEASFRQLTLGARYALSKRTFLYVIAAEQTASGTGSNNAGAVAQINGGAASATGEQRNYRFGINHRF